MYYQGGYDQSMGKYSLGIVLRAYIIRKAIENNIKEVDFLKGAYEQKYKWNAVDRKTMNMTIINNTYRGKMYYAVHNIKKKGRVLHNINRSQ